MKIKINNREMELPEGSTVAEALQAASISPQGIATAVNGNVVTGDQRPTTRLHEGDSLLIIKAHYGG